uniref:Ran-binding protein 9 n=1 Tax=Trichogramma kaykai TaxID=54128 RepID=A0ABD2WAN5_9HYME
MDRSKLLKTMQNQTLDRLKMLYPMVNEDDTPLPKSWSSKDKYNYIGLSQNNLRVHYKGYGKTHKDAASVRTTHPIPAACGLYYFEVKIVSKGRDGYMGIGLSAHGVNVNRLPGWDKNSYGYHGDDGHSFCSSGTGQPYGPTFTTGDIIGCGVNLVDNTAFYTKNGHHLGTAFSDLPPNLYPTVGLQTPGEVVDANFGQTPFLFDITDMINELRVRTRLRIINYSTTALSQGQWQEVLNKMVSAYLVHHGYCETARVFANTSGQVFNEDFNAIKNRQRILKLILSGDMGKAIELTNELYPGLLQKNCDLMFALKCRQFVEMVNGTDSENSIKKKSSVIKSTKVIVQPNIPFNAISSNNTIFNGSNSSLNNGQIIDDIDMEDYSSVTTINSSVHSNFYDVDSSKHLSIPPKFIDLESNCKGNNFPKNSKDLEEIGINVNLMEIDSSSSSPHNKIKVTDMSGLACSKKQFCGGNRHTIEKMLEFGKQLHADSMHLMRKNGKNKTNKKMLRDAFSLLAYANPWTSPVGWQLDPRQRETVCARLNSAILESCCLPRRPPLEVTISHAKELVHLMSTVGLGSCGFASVNNIIDY